MKSKMSKKLIAFILCMVLVICNSVSILADTPAPETATVEKQVKETKTANGKKASDDEAGDTENVSPQSEESAPEVKTTEKKEETTEATTQKKDEADEVTTKAKEETEKADETTTEAKETTKKEETTETQEEKTTKAKEETSETSGEKDTEKTTEAEEKTAPTELTYDDENVTVTVSAVAEGAIPEGAELKVVPILKDDTETKDQYTEVEQKIQEKAAETETEIKGFLAYDITFVDADGNEIEPNSEVKVSMEYKEAALPAEITAEDAKTSEVSVMHLEEDDSGNVSKVVDMGEASQLKQVETTENNKVNKAEFITESFSVYTLTWTQLMVGSKKIEIHYIDSADGKEISGKNGEGEFDKDEWINLSTNDFQVSIDGYTYSRTVIASSKESALNQENTNIKYIKVSRKDRNWEVRYKTNGNDWGEGTKWNNYYGNPTIYIIYDKNTTGDPGSGTETLGAPSHNKYIKQNELGKDYTLTLDVTGKRGEKSGIDVLLVIDKSGSMGTWPGYPNDENDFFNLLPDLKDTVTETIIPAVLPNTDSINSIAAVSFSSSNYSNSETDWKGYNNRNEITSWINNLEAGGGTNWELAMMKAEQKLEERVSNNQKVVIFLSDGAPGYYYEWGIEQGSGTPNNSEIKTARDQAVDYVKESSYLKNSTIYSVYLTSGTQNSMTTFASDLRGAGVNATAIDGTNVKTSLEDLINSIVTPEYKNVTITDTLSEYVELTSEDSTNFVVTKKSQNGQSEPLNSSQYKVKTSKDEDGRTKITLELLNGNALEDNVTYSLSFHVKPTQTAIDTFVEEGGYIHTGDIGTDAPDVAEENWTSSGKDGFYSNTSAEVQYTENDGTQQSAVYDKPVVQIDTEGMDIPEPNPVDGSITKTMGMKDENGYPINLEVKTSLKETSVDAKVDVILIIDTSKSMNDDDRIGATKQAAQAFVNNFVGETTSNVHRVGIVTFGSDASKVNYGDYWNPSYFSGNPDTINQKIDGLWATGGTNTEAGLNAALEMAKETENRTYVIFMTDGVPTYSMSSGSGGTSCSTSEYNAAVNKANELKAAVEGIYTVGLLMNSMSGGEKDVARRLLASPNRYLSNDGYDNCYLNSNSSDAIEDLSSSKRTWDTRQDKTYSIGYFEINSVADSGEALKEAWEALATLINNQTDGSTGDGWIVTDTMADYVTFQSLDKSDMNGHELTLVKDNGIDRLQTTLTMEDGTAETFVVAEYNYATETITWCLNSQLAEHFRAGGKDNYTYNLTYYVTFEDNGATGFFPTNESTYVDPGENQDEIYPEKMPFFVNLVGTKYDEDNENTKLSGAQFTIYEDASATSPIGTAESDDEGHFAFQFGQTDFENITQSGDSSESYKMIIYLKETQAPTGGYIADNTLYQLEINVTNVEYATSNSGQGQIGTPTGTVDVKRINGDDNSLLSIDKTNNSIVLNFANKSRPDWGIVKRNGNNHSQFLEGAVFGLYVKTGDSVANDPAYTGESDARGIIASWMPKDGSTTINSKDILVGTYILKEITAPDGYKLSDVEWKIDIAETSVTIRHLAGTDFTAIDSVSTEDLTKLELEGEYYYYDNTMSYDLPEAGGSGIYWYTFSGTLLMAGAALIVYRQKRKREVLLRK